MTYQIGDFIYNTRFLIGQGSCSKVYPGLNTKTGEEVAVKAFVKPKAEEL